jgi:uncharacterized protein YceK
LDCAPPDNCQNWHVLFITATNMPCSIVHDTAMLAAHSCHF